MHWVLEGWARLSIKKITFTLFVVERLTYVSFVQLSSLRGYRALLKVPTAATWYCWDLSSKPSDQKLPLHMSWYFLNFLCKCIEIKLKAIFNMCPDFYITIGYCFFYNNNNFAWATPATNHSLFIKFPLWFIKSMDNACFNSCCLRFSLSPKKWNILSMLKYAACFRLWTKLHLA